MHLIGTAQEQEEEYKAHISCWYLQMDMSTMHQPPDMESVITSRRNDSRIQQSKDLSQV